MSFISILCI